MSALKQYTDQFSQYGERSNAASSAALNALRPAALAALEGKELPRKGGEDYETTDLDAMYAPDYGLNIDRIDVSADIDEPFRCDVPNLSTSLYYIFNDSYHGSGFTSGQLPDGVIVDSLRNATGMAADIICKHYGTVAPIDNPQVALNTLLAQDGILVYIPAGVAVEKPIQLVNLLRANSPVMTNRRALIIVEPGAQAKMLVCDHTQSDGIDFLNTQVVEVIVGKGATFDLYDLEEASERTRRVSSVWVRQAAESNVLINGITLTNGTTRNDYHIEIEGEHAETRLLGMAIGSNSQHIDNHTYIGHNVGYCHSNELFKYVLDDEATGAFTGKILVAPGSPRTEAYQSNRNICASNTAKMYTKPQLEIYTDDVKCGHGSTVGQLDQEAMFYMQTRGISCHEARTLLMQAFMSDVIDGVRLEALKGRLHHLVEKRFAGTLAQCGTCAAARTCHAKIKK